jgi:protein O-mannosyl-transferase
MRNPTGSSSPAARPILLCLLALVVIAGAYLPALEGPFIWDDRKLVLEAPAVQSWQPLGRYFATPFWTDGDSGAESAAFYRPLTTLSYALDRQLHGTNPAGFHLSNLLWHLVCAGLLAALARRRGAAPPVAILIGAGWALLPRLTECVAWISGRTDSLATACVLGALLLWDRIHGWRRWTAGLLLLAGLFAKEVALGGLCAVAVLEWHDAGADAWRERAGRLWPVVVAGAAYAALRLHALGPGGSGSAPTLGPVRRAFTVLEALGTYFVMVLDAWRPRSRIGVLGAPETFRVVIGALALGGAIWLGRRQWRRLDRADAAAWSLASIALALVLQVVPLPTEVVAADRFLYLPLAGVTLGLVGPVDRILGRSRWALAGAVALVMSLGVATWLRAADYGDEVRFWVRAVQTTPAANPLPTLELGNLFFRAGWYDPALSLYRRASQPVPGLPITVQATATANAASTLSFLGRYDEAHTLLERLAAEQPGAAERQQALGLLEVRRLHFDAAREHFSIALRLRPDYAAARSAIASLPSLEADAQFAFAPHVASASPEQRARSFTRLGRSVEAQGAWLVVLQTPSVSEAAAREAAAFLVRYARPNVARSGYELYLTRCGQRPDADLRGAFEARRADLERLAAARAELGL